MRLHDDIAAERGDVVGRVLSGGDGHDGWTDTAAVEDAIALLDAAEASALVPLVDEAERHRLRALHTTDERAAHWHPVLARRGEVAVGYAGVVLPHTPGLTAVGDVAVSREHTPCGPVLSVLLASLEGLAWQHAAGRLQVWIRHATAEDVSCATDEGYGIDRRLAVLGRHLPVPVAEPSAPPPAGITIRAARPDLDDEGIVAVLAAAYGAGPDGGWDLPRFRERAALDWFRHEDLLVAVDEVGRILGMHWLKRRSATVGEVYNLAIHPDGQGAGLGGALLHAGLAHLTDVGCDEVLLWVDRANERAVRLYTSQGLTTRWEDVALGRTLRGSAR
ncbi:GNAT family N-acetyltransferase [Nitriliruptor alkaliphilus]|uniref:GNAT family N-acetyltransferase n=1 Tax=Nitriliruptor alkaliphilus TaxID=427918 RepID=UPI000695A80C|nr:GNAT family N-acetyltransferase [Nitriliruptor alkaliphilus]